MLGEMVVLIYHTRRFGRGAVLFGYPGAELRDLSLYWVCKST